MASLTTPTEIRSRSPRVRGVSNMVCVARNPLSLTDSLLPRTEQHFKSATTGVATKSMRNELNRLVQTVSDPAAKRVCLAGSSVHSPLMGLTFKKIFDMEMQSFFYLFTRYLTQKAQSQDLYILYHLDDHHCTDVIQSEWDRIKSPAADQIVPYDKLPKVTSPDALKKLAVLKVNGGLGTSMGTHRSDFIRPVVDGTSCHRYDRSEVCSGGQRRYDLPGPHRTPDRTSQHDAPCRCPTHLDDFVQYA